MGSVVEELIVRYRLDASPFLSASKQVDDASRRNAASFDTVGSKLGSVFGVAKNVAFGLAASATAVAAFGYSAMQAAARFDTLQRVFGAAVGSMEGGRRVMEGLEDYATKSAFSLEALADAAKTLAAGGMDISRFLPIIERFALVISGVDPSGLQMVAGALLRSKGGGYGEAMEIFRRAGVGTPDLRAEGINVTKGGEVMAQSKEFLSAIERISQGRLKTMADAVPGGAETKLSNAGDVIGQAFRRLGESINEKVLPAVTAFTDEVKNLVDSGTFETFGTGMAELAGVFTKEDIVGHLARFGAALRGIPDFISQLRDIFGPLIDLGNNLSPVGQIGNIVRPLAELSGFNNVQRSLAESDAAEQEAMSVMRKIRRKKSIGDPLKTPEIETPGQGELPAQTNLLREIAENTKPIQDFKRMILGGGEVGAKGINAVEIGQLRRGAHGEAMRLMSRAFGLMLDPYLGDLARAR